MPANENEPVPANEANVGPVGLTAKLNDPVAGT
jgi:hypothetical protein